VLGYLGKRGLFFIWIPGGSGVNFFSEALRH
jgi:hypothetical protein